MEEGTRADILLMTQELKAKERLELRDNTVTTKVMSETHSFETRAGAL